MDSRLIAQATRAALDGSMPFPQIVASLINASVEYYHVDYIGRSFTYYDGADGQVVAAIEFEQLPPVAAEFDVAALRAAILDSQQNGQKFRDFTHRAMRAGVQGYYAFLRGRRVTYFGRTGDQHVEWFPGAKQSQ